MKIVGVFQSNFQIWKDRASLLVPKALLISIWSHISGVYPMTTQALHTKRINLSPFTKDFRVWGAPIETKLIYLRVTLWVTSSPTA